MFRKRAVGQLAFTCDNIEKFLLLVDSLIISYLSHRGYILSYYDFNFDIEDGTKWLDPAEPITQARIKKWAQALRIPEQDVRSRYEKLAGDFQLQFQTIPELKGN